MIKTPELPYDLAADLRLAEINAKLDRVREIQSATTSYDIIETEAIVDGVEVVMVQCGERGVYQPKSDIDDGIVTMDEMYRAVTE